VPIPRWKPTFARWRSSHLCLALVWVLCACSALPARPPSGLNARFSSERADVHAASLERAREVALAFDAAFWLIQDLPHARRHERAQVYVVEGSEQSWSGLTRVDGWIEITTGDEELGPRYIVAHELVHFLLESEWDPLPQVVEEGLCDSIAARFDPAQAARQRADMALHLAAAAGHGLVVSLPPANDPKGAPKPTMLSIPLDTRRLPEPQRALTLDSRDMARYSGEPIRTVLYGLGFLIVERIGPAGLMGMCVIAKSTCAQQIDPLVLLQAVDLPPEQGWRSRPLTAELLGEAEMQVLRESVLRRRRETAGESRAR
jgi:hypothetical protein